MRVFVTGCTGFLGNNVVSALLQANHTVVGLARNLDKVRWLLGDTPLQLVHGDMRDVEGFADDLRGCDAVVHTAAYFRESFNPGDHAAALQAINIDATLALMRAADAASVRRFVHISSAGSVGQRPDGTPGDEDTPPSEHQMQSLYFRSKRDGDRKIAAFVPDHGMQIVEILPGWMWGPGDAGPTSAGRLVLNFLAGKLPAIPRGGANVVDARDVARGIVAALEHPSPRDRYIIAGDHHRLYECLDHVGKVVGKTPPREIPVRMALAYAHINEAWSRLVGRPPSAPVAGVQVFAEPHHVSSDRARADLGATFRPFCETARDTVKWLQTHGIYEGAAPPETTTEPPSTAAGRTSASA